MANDVMTPSQQLAVLRRIWGRDREGFVFLPWIAGGASTVDERKRGFHEGPAYEWPKDEEKILSYLGTHADDDVYFTPSLFEMPVRQNETAVAERALWADLDAASPDIDEWRPSIAWETSPKRYQGIWLLDRPLVGASWAGRENQRLTTALGADPSGWDTTQLLRVPGRPNHKVEYRGKRIVGRLLWTDGPRYKLDQLTDLPEITVTDAERQADLLDEDLLRGVDRRAVWARVRLKVSKQVREYMAQKGEVSAGEADRSTVLWQIERDLADAGCTLAEIVALVRASAWNKYRGRADELKRLKIEAARAIQERGGGKAGEDGDALEIVEDIVRPAPALLSTLMGGRRQRPRWLVNNIWSVGGVGFTAGQPKMYKSWVALDMALSVATGQCFLGEPQFHTPDGGVPVLYVQEEDSQMAVVNHAESVVMGRNPELHPWGVVEAVDQEPGRRGVVWRPGTDNLNNFHVYVRQGFSASDEAWQSWLDDMIGDLHIGLVVIDTLGTTAGEVDTDRASELTDKILRPLRTLAAKHGTAVNVVHHNKKDAGNGRAGQSMLGSVALHAWVEDALYLREKSPWRDGWQVRVERESKAAPDTKFDIRVPRFGLRVEHDGATRGRGEAGFRSSEMVWWSPEVVWNLAEEAGTETITPTPAERRAQGYVPGQNIARILAETGGKRPGGCSFGHLQTVTSMTPGELRKQLTNALRSGLITGDEETGYKSR